MTLDNDELKWRLGLTLVMMLLFMGALIVITSTVVTEARQGIERQTVKHWEVAHLPEDAGYRPIRVEVVDTGGACVYVVRAYAAGEGNSPAIAVVSKTALPAGKGCS